RFNGSRSRAICTLHLSNFPHCRRVLRGANCMTATRADLIEFRRLASKDARAAIALLNRLAVASFADRHEARRFSEGVGRFDERADIKTLFSWYKTAFADVDPGGCRQGNAPLDVLVAWYRM